VTKGIKTNIVIASKISANDKFSALTSVLAVMVQPCRISVLDEDPAAPVSVL
jgi:hypothetical protein